MLFKVVEVAKITSGMLTMATKSPCECDILIGFQSENVPLMYTLLPPPSHLNTVGRAFSSIDAPSLIVLVLAL